MSQAVGNVGYESPLIRSSVLTRFLTDRISLCQSMAPRRRFGAYFRQTCRSDSNRSHGQTQANV